MNTRQSPTRGLAAGFIAAACFAVFFLLVDVVQGYPLRTPAYMSGLVFSFTTALPASARLAVFTVLHFALFGVAGVLVDRVLTRLEMPPRLVVGMVLGFLLFDIVFYGSVLGLGVNVVRELGWPEVLVGNVLAGVAMMAYLRARSGERVFDVESIWRDHPVVQHGLVAGIIGAGVVALWFLVVDALQHRLFYTPAALGSALFYGADHPGDVVITAPLVVGYTLVHFTVFALAGLLAARFVNAVAQDPPMLIGLVLFFVTLEVLSLGLLTAMAAWLFMTIAWWLPIIANLLAAGAMAFYLWRAHSGLRAAVVAH